MKLFYLLRAVSSYRPGAGPSIEDYAQEVLGQIERSRKLNGSPKSVNELRDMCARLVPELRDWRAVTGSWLDPTGNTTFLNELARLASDVRNCHMVSVVSDAARSGQRVFVVVGGSHVIMQERALRAAAAKN